MSEDRQTLIHSENDPHQDASAVVEPVQSEPSVWDWFISLLHGRPIPIPEMQADGDAPADFQDRELFDSRSEPLAQQAGDHAIEQSSASGWKAAHWRFPSALILGFMAQISLQSSQEEARIGLVLYLLAAGIFIWALIEGDLRVDRPMERLTGSGFAGVRWPYLAASAVLAVLTFLASGDNSFTTAGILFWAGSLICAFTAFWDGERSLERALNGLWVQMRRPRWSITWDRWTLLVLASFALIVWFRLVDLENMPYEMWSDQAEKLLDVQDVLNGQTRIFFPRNTGREPLQFYMAAATVRWLGTGISFQSLKIGTALAGIVALPFVYLFGREYGNRLTGWAAMALAGIAYWPNVISRVGLRFPLYPLFAAPAMFFLVRGLRRKRRNDFLLCGLAVGMGLLGYSPARVIPLAIAIGVLVFLLHPGSRHWRWPALVWLAMAGWIAFLVFVPLLRVAVDMPDAFLFRMFSRMAETERALPGPAIQIFLQNLWNGLLMFNWDSGEIWVVTLPGRPLLDWISGALFILGLVWTVVRYIRKRDWRDALILISLVVLILPSVLSLAFPDENPAPNRASGALVVVFTLAAIPLAGILAWFETQFIHRSKRFWGGLLVLALFWLAARQNFNLAMVEFAGQVRNGTWNTREAGGIVHNFATTIGEYEHAHVVAYPHWMDTRLVGILSGTPYTDFGIWPDQIETLSPTSEPQLFLLNVNDAEGLQVLRQRFPQGVLSRFESEVEGRDFLIYFVASSEAEELLSIELRRNADLQVYGLKIDVRWMKSFV